MPRRPRAVPAQKRLVKDQLPDVILENPNESVSKSITFLKQLTTVALSSIAYLRDLFPSECFINKKMAGQPIYVLRGSDEQPKTKTFINWLKEAFKLVHSHHLKKLMLVIKKESVILEVYTFSFSYNQEAIQVDLSGEVDGKVVLEQSQEKTQKTGDDSLPDDIVRSVRQLIRCVLAYNTTLPPLPFDAQFSMNIFVDEDTPEHLMPVGLYYKLEDMGVLNFSPEVETLKLGKVETKFSSLSLSTKTTPINWEDEIGAVGIQQEQINPMENEDSSDVDEIPSSQPEHFHITSLASSTSQLNLSGNKPNENDSNATNLSEKLSVSSLKDKVVACICECSELIDDTIVCSSCNTYQHKTCYKMLENHQVDTHVCVKCHNPDEGKVCSVPELLKEDNRKESALFRQALMYCSNSSQVSCKRLMIHLKVPREMGDVLFKRLDTEGCLEPSTNRGLVRNVKPDLQVNLEKYFLSQPPAVNMEMDVPDSPVSISSEGNITFKRQHSEEMYYSPSVFSPPPKRRKTMVSAIKVKN